MSVWVASQLVGLLGTFAGIAWGVLRFFVPPTERQGRAAALAAVALGGFVNQLVQTWQSPADPVRAALAVLLYAGSSALFWGAVRACAAARPTAIFERDVPRLLIERAPYSVVRHPFYAAYSMFWLAGGVGTGAWSTTMVAAAMIAVYVHAARTEEAKFAASALSATYAAYRVRTGFLLPRLWR